MEADIQFALQQPKPILLDEWQYIPAVWDAVRRAVDKDGRGAQFLLTGSAGRVKGTHSGAARIVPLRMRPLSLDERQIEMTTVSFEALLFNEKPEKISGKTDVGLEIYIEEILRSGFPAIRLFSGRALNAQLNGYIDRIVDVELPESGFMIRKPVVMKRWLTAYASVVGTTTSFEKIRDAATADMPDKPAKTTVLSYKEALEKIWILDPVQAWQPSRNQLKSLTVSPKLHLADPALAASLLGVQGKALKSGQEGVLLGRFFESLVTLSVRSLAQRFQSHVYHFRTKGGDKEVDLIVERPDKKVLAIEVKLSENISDEDVKNLHWLKSKIGDELVDAMVIHTGKYAYRRPDGVAVVPAALLGA